MLNQTVVDARPESQSKTSGDRQRFIRRAKAQIKEAVKRAISEGDIKSLEKGNVRVPVKDMNEPTFESDGQTGSRDRVYTGNKDWIPGDTVDRPEGGAGGSGSEASDTGEGNDDFTFILTPEEFYEFLFDDMDLPDLMKRSMKQITKVVRRRAGYVTTGNPSQLDIRQTYKYAYARQRALGRPTTNDIEAAEEAVGVAQGSGNQFDVEMYEDVLNELKKAQARIPMIDEIDLRYRNYPPKPEPITQAVMFCLMDVSGSMDEQRKNLAKRFFLLLYVWLMKQFKQKVELVFIRHHTVAEEVDEEAFFHATESGGTVVSPAIALMQEIIKARYNPSDWNIYGCYASDGDNWSFDNVKVVEKMEYLMPMLQYFAYLQVEQTPDTGNDSSLWNAYKQVGNSHKNMNQVFAAEAGDIWKVFKELFSKDLNK